MKVRMEYEKPIKYCNTSSKTDMQNDCTPMNPIFITIEGKLNPFYVQYISSDIDLVMLITLFFPTKVAFVSERVLTDVLADYKREPNTLQ